MAKEKYTTVEKLTGPIIVAAEAEEGNGGTPTKASLEAVNAAHQLTDGPVWVAFSAADPDLEVLGAAGVEAAFVREDAGPWRLAARTAELVEAIIAARGAPEAVLLPGTYWGKETCAHLGASLDGAAVVDVAEVRVQDGTISARKAVLGGSWVTEFTVERGVPVISFTGSAKFPAGSASSQCERIVLQVDSSPAVQNVEVISSARSEGDGAAQLAEAEIAVVGGRGAEDDFSLVGDLADLLGGAVGATRVACDEGLADRSLQVGQTGVTISPRVYVGVGVSGAIHHTCGMQGAEVVVAVCDDPDAPIFEIADFGIVGDVNEVLPQALEALREKLPERS